jgi:SAM-dependent methyltransferase
MKMHDVPGSGLERQRAIYGGDFYRSFRRLRWLFRFDCRYRILIMEQLFARRGIPFEGLKVFELGFGTGYLLKRFDWSCAIHGCELSPQAVEQLKIRSGMERYRELKLVCAGPEGEAVFPDRDYDLVIASHVLEHVPDDEETLRRLAEHTRPGGYGLFFVPLERPNCSRSHHERTYSRPGFAPLLERCGFEPLDLACNMRFDYYPNSLIIWLETRMPAAGYLAEGLANFFYSLWPIPLMQLVDRGLERCSCNPRQLAVLARRKES